MVDQSSVYLTQNPISTPKPLFHLCSICLFTEQIFIGSNCGDQARCWCLPLWSCILRVLFSPHFTSCDLADCLLFQILELEPWRRTICSSKASPITRFQLPPNPGTFSLNNLTLKLLQSTAQAHMHSSTVLVTNTDPSNLLLHQSGQINP